MESMTTLSDMLFKTSALIRSFFSQNGSAQTASAADSLFSELLSTTTGKNLDFAASSGASAAQTSGASIGASRASATGLLHQNVSDMKATLHQAISAIKSRTSIPSGTHQAHRQGRDETARSEARAAAETTSPKPGIDETVNASSRPSANADGPATITEETAPSNAPQGAGACSDLNDILTELLALIQLMIQALMQIQKSAGETSTAETAAVADLTALAGGEGASGLAAALGEQAADAAALQADEMPPQMESENLFAFLQALEKNIQALLVHEDNKASFTDDASHAVAANAALTETLEQLSRLDSDMEQALMLLYQRQGYRGAASTEDKRGGAAENPPALREGAQAAKLLADTVGNGDRAADAALSATAFKGPVNLALMGDTLPDSGNGPGGRSLPFTEMHSSLRTGSSEGTQATGTYSFASTLSAFRAVNGGTTGLPSVVDQVVLYLNRSAKNGQNQVTVQLQPGDMGKITVRLDFDKEGKVQGTVTAENPKTLDLLQKDSRSLERALQDAGLRADPGSLQFSLQQENRSSMELADRYTQSTSNNISSDEAGEPELVEMGAIAETYYLTPTGVNIRV